MVQIAGRYEPVKSENFAAHLMSFGVPEELAKGAENDKSIYEITQNGDKVSIKVLHDKPVNTEVILNKEVDESHGGSVFKTRSALDGDTLTLTSKYSNGRSETKTFKFSDTGLTMTLHEDGSKVPDGVRVFKRL